MMYKTRRDLIHQLKKEGKIEEFKKDENFFLVREDCRINSVKAGDGTVSDEVILKKSDILVVKEWGDAENWTKIVIV